MRRCLSVLLVSVFMVLPVHNSQAAGDAAKGEAKAAACAACHGADGNSTNPEWPKLAGQHAAYLVKQITDFQAAAMRSNPLMAPMLVGVSEQDAADLAAYFSSKPPTLGFASAEWHDLGERIYRAGIKESGTPACIACHGPRGLGNPLAGFPRLAGQHAKYTLKQLENFRSLTRRNDVGEMMRDAVRYMTPAQMQAVASYIAGLR